MIKNIEDLKNIQIVCRNQEQVKNCLNHLGQLGFKVSYYGREGFFFIIRYNDELSGFSNYGTLAGDKYIEFYNKELAKTLQKLIKEKEEKEKEKLPDFEVAEDGRIIKINNYSSEQVIYVACDYNHIREGYEIFNLNPTFLDFTLKYGLLFSTKEARDKAMFKLEIENKLKNIAERLNKGQKIDWEDENQKKYEIYYDYIHKKIECRAFCYCKDQGVIYCLNKNFLKVAKKEIGEENLIKYFKD